MEFGKRVKTGMLLAGMALGSPEISKAQEPESTTEESSERQIFADEKGEQVEAEFDGIRIIGTIEFVERTKEALTLLQESPSFLTAKPYLQQIEQRKHSGMRVGKEESTFGVRYSTAMGSDLIWYAGDIAHDSYHSFLFHVEKKERWVGKEAEKKCLEYQIQVLKELSAPEWTIETLEYLKINPKYQRVPVWNRDW